MKIHHIRNATLVIETDNHFILVDPMLGKKGSSLPISFFRFKMKRNPLVELPTNSKDILDKVTHCLITHLHPDHLDPDGEAFLKQNNIPITCSDLDKKALEKKGLKVTNTLSYWKESEFLDGKITGIPALHGYGFIAKPMGNVMGFYISFPNDKSLYISSDTIYTDEVNKVLKEFQPDIAIMAAGKAQLDLGKPLLMDDNDIVKFAENAPNNVIANHMESLNHCPNTRTHVKSLLEAKGLLEKVAIPEDGEVVEFKQQVL